MHCAHESQNITWTPKKQRGLQEYEHMHSSFEKNGVRSSDYIIAPDWVSEAGDPTNPFQRRRYRPWAYEFSGARFWPGGTAERRVQQDVRHLRQLQQEEEVEKREEVPVPMAIAGQSPEWKQEVEAICQVNDPKDAGYERRTRIPPTYRNLWQPRRVAGGSRLPPYPGFTMNASSDSMPEYHGLHVSRSAEGYAAGRVRPAEPHHSVHSALPLRHATESFKLPYLNFANSQWMSKFNVD